MLNITRRTMVLGSAASLVSIHARAAEPIVRAKQFHNQPVESHQHTFLVDLWEAVKKETDGKVEVTVFPLNNKVAGGDPGVLDMLVNGEVEFFTLIGGLVARIVPPMDIQGLPFAFTSSGQVHAANDGDLGAYLSKECAAKGIHRFQYGLLENGFRQMSSVAKPIRNADDLAGFRMRVPDGKLFQDLFATLGAQPVPLNFKDMMLAFQEKRIDGQENPLVVTEVNKLYEVTKYMSISNHMWAGFNLIANLDFWNRIPVEIQEVINRNVVKYVAAQRAHVQNLNASLEPALQAKGMIFNVADGESFRRKLAGGFYPRWKGQLGTTAWDLLEKDIGKLG